MKLDGAIFPIERRSIGACIDLATVFYRVHARSLLALSLCFGIPAVALSYWVSRETELGMFWSLLAFYAASPFLGAGIVYGAGRRLFGDSFSAGICLWGILTRLIALTFSFAIVRVAMVLAFFFFFFPAWLLGTQYGFLSETLLLEDAPFSKVSRRLAELTRGGFGMLAWRLLVIIFFAAVMGSSFFMMFDLLSRAIVGWPILTGRISSSLYVFDEIGTLLASDPRVVATVQAVLWLVYPLARLAWFFCYLDARIRKECWDLELDFRVEAKRLEAVT